jgi:hypothetical protein
MMCTTKDIQELLPAYREQALSQEDRSRVDGHLTDCGDCRAELDLLVILAAEPVPDPGEAFWAAMPGKVYRQVLKGRELSRSWWDLRVPVSISLPRWAWAATAVLLVASVSWLTVRPAPLRTARVTTPVRGDLRTALNTADVLEFADLSDMEVDAVDLWATEELALLQDDLLDVMRNSADLGLDERLAELTAEELEKLSRMLDSRNEEG